MRDRVRARLVAVGRRVRRIERRELAEFGRWIENTDNLIHLTILLFVPMVLALVTLISNATTELSFLLFPPLASGAYTLFADPEGRYASPTKFVVGLTVGALCGWAALSTFATLYGVSITDLGLRPESAALSIFLTGAVTWALDVEEPAAFSTALLVLVTEQASPSQYVTTVVLGSLIVAVSFAVWRDEFYEERAHYLYGTTYGDDHVLVPMRGETAETTALFGARLAAAHEAGKVVLLDVVDDDRIAAAERAVLEGDDSSGPTDVDDVETDGSDVADEAAQRAAAESASRLEAYAATIRTRVGVPCEVVVASGDPERATVETARTTNCDLVVTPYEEVRGSLSPFVRSLFSGPYDAIAFRSTTGTQRWKRILVTVSRPGDSAHAMLDFASRLAGRSGNVSVCTCISDEVERRPAETQLANLVETIDCPVETRVARSDVRDFIQSNAGAYDLVVLGSSGDRSAASRFVAPPTFERLREVDCDVAVVDRGSV
ncbi:Universal stress protein family protein [Halogranum amylolyticum]|uniref:Universal stress protein family protein n=1 Tax=Halogranum amylolyticum TaxID=660520 RepID=A0A1H8N653_9EURY|nr:HPP family protein [Halogranum amylolyticum]SEO25026.1 Universal stress protein family protein [Halogranum amylolyticum]